MYYIEDIRKYYYITYKYYITFYFCNLNLKETNIRI